MTIETELYASAAEVEAQALSLMNTKSRGSRADTVNAARELLRKFHEQAGSSVRDKWHSFLFQMVTKYHDLFM